MLWKRGHDDTLAITVALGGGGAPSTKLHSHNAYEWSVPRDMLLWYSILIADAWKEGPLIYCCAPKDIPSSRWMVLYNESNKEWTKHKTVRGHGESIGAQEFAVYLCTYIENIVKTSIWHWNRIISTLQKSRNALMEKPYILTGDVGLADLCEWFSELSLRRT